jgi:tetrahydromethanopterin S-methyltransferase subunit A
MVIKGIPVTKTLVTEEIERFNRCSLTSSEDLLKRVDFDSKRSAVSELVVSSPSGNPAVRSEQLAVSIQREQSAEETQVNFSQRGS